MDSITPVNGSELSFSNKIDLNPKVATGGSFKQTMINNLTETNASLIQADKLSEDFIVGKNVDLHRVIIAMERAQVAMQYTVQIRNKLVEGAQELLRMQI